MSVRRIAHAARVSIATVSLALGNSPKITEATRRRVLRAAAKIGYRPNAKVAELMAHLRLGRQGRRDACLGVVSFYDDPRPWEKSLHLTRIHDGMRHRAEALGYRLETLWLREPRMTHRRFCNILDARGIQGLLCLGSPNLDEDIPAEFDHYAIVTQGLSIRTPLHRVVSHVYNDMWHALTKAYALGYRRPGLVIGRYEEMRSGHAYLCVYLGWCQLMLKNSAALPVLELDRVEEKPLLSWLADHEPDVVIFVHHYNMLPEFRSVLKAHSIGTPEDLGVIAISQTLENTDFSGLQENQNLIGAWSVELVVSRIMNRDFGIPAHPRIEMVERQWVAGKTLRQPAG